MASNKDIVKFIRKSNNLVEARYKFDIWETRIFTKVLTTIHKDDKDFQEYTIYLRDIIDNFDLKGANASYDFLRAGARKLMKKSFFIPYETEEALRLLEVPIIASLDSLGSVKKKGKGKGQEYIKVSFHPKMKPYLLELKSQFTTYDVRNILKLPSVYSIRIFELLKQYERIGRRTIGLLELKEMLGITDEYPLYANFKQRVLLKAQRDLDKHTDICFTFKQHKEGRKVKRITFYIMSNVAKPLVKQDKPSEQKESFLNKLYLVVEPWGVTRVVLREWVAEFGVEQVERAVAYTKARYERGEVAKPAGHLYTMVRQADFVDGGAVEAQAKQAQSAEAAAKAKQAADVEAERQRLKRALYLNKVAVVREILSGEQAIFEEVFEEVRRSLPQYFSGELAGFALYEADQVVRSKVNLAVFKRFPERFDALDKAYAEQQKVLG